MIKNGTNDDSSDKVLKIWHLLKELKESHPIEVAEFAVVRGVSEISAFAWWANHTLKKRDTIIASVRQRIVKTTHKYEIEIQMSWMHAIELIQKMVIDYGKMHS